MLGVQLGFVDDPEAVAAVVRDSDRGGVTGCANITQARAALPVDEREPVELA